MLSETKIKEIIPEILQKLGGIATKKEICDYIAEHYELDDVDDLVKSKTRNESKYVQRVGNIVCHARKKGISLVEFDKFELVKIIDEKGKENWKFALPNIIPRQASLFSDKSVSIDTKKKEKERTAIKRDWDSIDVLRKEIGFEGEKFVFEKEQEFVRKHFPKKLKEVVWVSRDIGDGLGYDVKSVCHTNPNKPLYIEVKSTTSPNLDTSFNMTDNELRLFRSIDDKKIELQLHRNYDRNKDGFKCKIYSRKEILEEFHAVASVYTMKHRRTEI